MCRTADLETYMRDCEEIVEQAAVSDWGADAKVAFDRVSQTARVTSARLNREVDWREPVDAKPSVLLEDLRSLALAKKSLKKC